MAAEENLSKSANFSRVREIDFTYLFNDNINKLVEALGITRRIPKQSGTTLKAYKAAGTLQSGSVAEGETIPLSAYKVEPVPFGEITIHKWRKATSIEAVSEKGRDQSINMTNMAMIKDVQKNIREDFFNFLASGQGRANGSNFQATLAQCWGQLQSLFEDNSIEAVYFMNQIDVADYLSTAQISTQTAFGMRYVEDFLGLGTVILNSSVPTGKIYATARDNIVLYYVDVREDDIVQTFQFTTDELGLIGIHESADYTNLTVSNTVASGIRLFAERIDGIIVGTIGGGSSDIYLALDKDAVELPVDGTARINATVAPIGTAVTWTSSATDKATVSDGVVTGVSAGTATITATAGSVTATCTVTVSAGA